MSSIPDPIYFNPPEPAINAIIAALTNPAHSLSAVAEQHNTTADALALWLARPDIAHRLRAHESAHAARLRLSATTQLSQALEAVTKIILDFNRRASDAPAPSPAPAGEVFERSRGGENGGGSPTHDKQRNPNPTIPYLTAAHMACRATGLLLRLAKYNPAPIDIIQAPSERHAPRYSYDDTPRERNQNRARNFDPYTPYSDDTQPPARATTNAAPTAATTLHPHTTQQTPQPTITTTTPAPAASTPGRRADNNINTLQNEPAPNNPDSNTPPNPNSIFTLEDEDLDIDLDLDSDLDLDFENDQALNPELTKSQRSNLPNLITQLRHLAATHPP